MIKRFLGMKILGGQVCFIRILRITVWKSLKSTDMGSTIDSTLRSQSKKRTTTKKT